MTRPKDVGVMAHRTIELPEATYQLLLKQAARLQLPPERVLERLVLGDLALPPLEDAAETDLASAATDTAAALTAVERLTTLFADVAISDLEQHLNDPMLALANAEIETLIQ
jgi:hypothetical protein